MHKLHPKRYFTYKRFQRIPTRHRRKADRLLALPSFDLSEQSFGVQRAVQYYWSLACIEEDERLLTYAR